VPVINGLTDFNHPTQVVCDLLTMSEHLPPGRALEDCTVVFVGDRTNVCSSLMFIATQFGMSFVHAAPQAYQAPSDWLAVAELNALRSGGSVSVTEEVEDALATADFVYTDLWWWVDQMDEVPARRAAFMPRYQVDSELIARAPAHARFMHCLPASRGVEVTDEVIDGPRSIVFDQAENRLHAEKGILVWLTWPTLAQPTAAQARFHDRRARDFLAGAGFEHAGDAFDLSAGRA
jgi:putrescine carbamoyltransferase